MIELKKISKSFGNMVVLEDVTMKMNHGNIYGLIGYNGVGKTTLLKILAGIYTPERGEVLIEEEKVYENPRIKQEIFFMTEESLAFPQSTLEDMRRFYKGYYKGWSDQTYEGLLKLFQIDPREKISTFSKGMQRQGGLILAFSTHCKYMLLDEAFDGLDLVMRRLVNEMIKYYVSDKDGIILITSHNLTELEQLAHKIFMLNHGQLVFEESTKRIETLYHKCTFLWENHLTQIPLEELGMKLLEQREQTYVGIMKGSSDEILKKLSLIGCERIELDRVQLEELFQAEGKVKHVDWSKIFKETDLHS
ncbi:MAG TPA: ABC transporter ATP-binding protein [Candidatus Merdenecus merdavium]|nr:ABC transporter ATP-binding protein [Candidatus Merdenecus merdavium]